MDFNSIHSVKVYRGVCKLTHNLGVFGDPACGLLQSFALFGIAGRLGRCCMFDLTVGSFRGKMDTALVETLNTACVLLHGWNWPAPRATLAVLEPPRGPRSYSLVLNGPVVVSCLPRKTQPNKPSNQTGMDQSSLFPEALYRLAPLPELHPMPRSAGRCRVFRLS